jgi:hypothetical protein
MAARTMAESEGSNGETVISFEAKPQIQPGQWNGTPNVAALVRFEKCLIGPQSDGHAADFARLGMVLEPILQPILQQFLQLWRNWVLRPAQTDG